MSDQDDIPDLTGRQAQLVSLLPRSKPSLAKKMGIAKTTVENKINAIKEKGIDLKYDRDANQWYIADDRSKRLRHLSTRHKTSITRETTQLIEDEQAVIFRRLRRTEPLAAEPARRGGHESMGAILGDLHFGDVVEKEYWDDSAGEYQTQTVYNPEITAEKVEAFGRKLLRIKDLMESVVTFDDCYLFLLGDIATGMWVYDGQWQDVAIPLNEQVEESVTALYQLIGTLAAHFDTVQVRGVPGNHGTDRPSAAIGANTDLLTYSWTDFALRKAGVENVDFRNSETHEYLNTTARGWRFHVRHGHQEKEHVDETAASSRDWRGLVDEFDFDAAMKGHHHSPSYHKVMNRYDVFACPSPKPGGEFPSKIGKPDVSDHSDLGWAFGISDERPVTWQFLLDDRDETKLDPEMGVGATD